MEVTWLVWAHCRITPGERGPGTHSIGVWVAPGVGVDWVKRKKDAPPGIKPGFPGRLAHLFKINITYSLFKDAVSCADTRISVQ
jgi:hypothetical protein